MRVLIIEDDAPTAQSMALHLAAEGYEVELGTLGSEVLGRSAAGKFDIVLLDLGLPDMSGVQVIRQLRAESVGTPVVVVSGTSDIESKVQALGGGADDYITKPFHKQELLARLNAIARRAAGRDDRVIRTGPLSINLDNHDVEVDGTRVHLTAKEFAVLEALSLRKGTTLTKEMLLEHMYNGMDEPGIKIIDVFICKMRKKLCDAGLPAECIDTVWGRGYRLQDPHQTRAALTA